MSKSLENYTFKDVLEKKKIRIPMIQRDYAEGRLNKKVTDIRKNFSNELLKPIFGKVNYVKLDFVYGNDRENAFEPLDGQQRLTTLFLLYWIFRPKDEDILRSPDDKLHSLFTYQTRISSEDFCNALVRYYACDLINDRKDKLTKQKEINELKDNKEEPQLNQVNKNVEYEIGAWFNEDSDKIIAEKEEDIKLSDVICSKDWFEWDWHKDPSVCSMLVVIDQVMALIDKNHYVYTTDVYSNLERISFNLLDLDKLDMSDELYVKMNSRGKTLSDFDILKSTLEEEIQLQGNAVFDTDIETMWRTRIDGKWMDYFWQNYRDKKNNQDDFDYEDVKLVEDKYLRLLQRLIALNLLLSTKNTRYKEYRYVFACRSQRGEQSFEQMMQFYLDISFGLTGKDRMLNLREIMDDMDVLIYSNIQKGNNMYSDISKLLSGIHFNDSGTSTLLDLYLSDYLNYDTLAMFISMILFARKFKNAIVEDEKMKANFVNWMRFTRNTILNDNRYDKIDRFYALDDTIELLRQIVDEFANSNKGDILDFIANQLDVNRRKGIENERVVEEKTKARLRLSDTEWIKKLDEAEENDYLCGQVCSLLNWSKLEINRFDAYYKYLIQIVSKGVLKNPYNFYAAMLTYSDYRNKTSNSIYNFNKQRDRSFKQYLRLKENSSEYYGVRLKEFVDEWMQKYSNITADEFFNKCIENSTINSSDWRYFIVNCPSVMDFAREKIIVQREDGYWYLRSKIRADVEHREIFIESIGWRVIYPTINGNIDYDNPKCPNVIVKGNTDKDDPNSFLLTIQDNKTRIHISLAGNQQYELNVYNDESPQILSAIDLDKYLIEHIIIRPGLKE